MTELKPCIHLDHSPHYLERKLKIIPESEFGVEFKYWERQNVPYKGAPVNVQFCGLGKGRINGISQCYNGEKNCYAPCSKNHES